jgi:hypothetical protein
MNVLSPGAKLIAFAETQEPGAIYGSLDVF